MNGNGERNENDCFIIRMSSIYRKGPNENKIGLRLKEMSSAILYRITNLPENRITRTHLS